MKTLHLTLTKVPFDLMITGEKTVEFRKPTQWIKSRLWDKNGSLKQYDVVKFTNGYGRDKPYFIADFKTVNLSPFEDHFQNYTGLSVMIRKGDIKIFFGKILEKGNLK